MASPDFDPLFGDPQEEIPLANSPLVSVLAQLQFTPILKLGLEDCVAAFQEQIRETYPKLETEKFFVPQFLMDSQSQGNFLRRFLTKDNNWRVSLTPTFVALESKQYTSRADFMGRFRDVIDALMSVVNTAAVTRIGVRYVDHIKLPEANDIARMFRPELLGISNAPLNFHHLATEMFCDIAEGSLLAKWGQLPANGTYDPSVILPMSEPSWFLDLDASKTYNEPENFSVENIHDTAIALATRIYAFFRWATEPHFLTVYGAKP